jgi:SPP1 gp7 family putative phage head morphogenesis protein
MAQAPKAKAATVNETLRDRGIAHAVYLERLKRQVADAIIAELKDEVIPDLIEKLTARLARIEARGLEAGQGTKRLQDMLTVLETTLDAWATGLAKELAEKTVDIAEAEINWQDTQLQTAIPIKWDTVIPPTSVLSAALEQSPIDGVLLSEIVDRLAEGSRRSVERAIRLGIAEGESIDRITKRIADATDLTVSSAEAVARTAVGHASNMGRAVYYQDNQDIIAKVQWVATLDTSTCSRCQALDGQTFALDRGPRPPRHINCRCTTVPVLRPLRDLGLDAEDFEASTRASMNGQVPASLTYNEWLHRMPASIQDEALGPTRGRLFRAGELDVSDFVDRGGDPLTLDEIHQRERAAWNKAGL